MKKVPQIWTWFFVVRKWKFLFWKRKTKLWNWTWCLPGWKLDFWESFEDCAKREVYEEMWVQITDVELLWITNDILEEKHFVTLFFISKYFWWDIDIETFDEFSEYRWVDLESLPDDLFKPFEDFINDNSDLITKKISEST